MASRQERMAQRMRGAQRHQVQDVSFGELFPAVAPATYQPAPSLAPLPPSSARPTPNTSVKRARLATDPSLAKNSGFRQPPRRNSDRKSEASQPRPESRESEGKNDPYVMPDTSNESIHAAQPVANTNTNAQSNGPIRNIRASISPAFLHQADEDDLESLPEPTPRDGNSRRSGRPDKPALALRSPFEVSRSHADAPGSAHHQAIPPGTSSSVTRSTARLEQMAAAEDELSGMGLYSFASSSPLVRKTSRTVASTGSRLARTSAGSRQTRTALPPQDFDELSPEQPKDQADPMEGIGYGEVADEADGEEELDAAENAQVEDETKRLLKTGQDVLRRAMMSSSPVADPVAFDLPQLTPKKPLDKIQLADVNDQVAEETPNAAAAKVLGKNKISAGLPGATAEEFRVVAPAKSRGHGKQHQAHRPDDVQDDALSKKRGRRRKGRVAAAQVPERQVPVARPETNAQGKEEHLNHVSQKRSGRPSKHEQEPDPGPQVDEADAESEAMEGEQALKLVRPKRNSQKSVLEPSALGKRNGRRKTEPEPEPEADQFERELEQEDHVVEEGPRKKARQSTGADEEHARRRQSTKQHLRRRHGSSKNGVPITVQRFARNLAGPWITDGENEDILHSSIPFQDDHRSANIIDVLSQVCEELLVVNIDSVGEACASAQDRAHKKELRIKLRALESFREEIGTRMLEHAVTLDNLGTLQKRIKEVQKEKVALRNEILEIKREREEVALRMDAVRLTHARDGRTALHQIKLSSAMHNIDLAVETGPAKEDYELTSEQRRVAELANLELAIRQVAEDASSKSQAGGALRQIREFNAFLERVARALEGR